MSIVIGSWPLSGDFGAIGLEQVARTLRACVDFGFWEFDTAPNYGDGFAERCLGTELGLMPGVRISTKCGNQPGIGKSFAVDDLRRSVEASLRRLRVERIHTLYLHNPRDEIGDYDAVLALFDELVQAGHIERRGISLAKGHDYPLPLLQRFDVVQDDANLLSMGALQRAGELGDGVCFAARSPLATGLLGGHIERDTRFAADDHRSGWLAGERLSSLVERLAAIRRLSTIPLPQLASRFILHHPSVDRAIFGVKRPEHVVALAGARDDGPLPPELSTALEQEWQRDFGRPAEQHLGY